MSSELLVAILAGLGGMLGWGFADFCAKKTMDVVGDIASLAWGHVFGTLALVALALYQLAAHGHQLEIPRGVSIWLLLVFFGVLQAIVYLIVYRGFSKGQLALLNPVFASFTGLTALMSILFFGEVMGGYLPLGLAIIFVGILLISLDLQALRSRKVSFAHIPGLKEVAIGTLLAAFWTLFWGKLTNGQDWISYTLFMYAIMTVAILIWSKIKNIDLKNVRSNLWFFLIFIGVGEVVAYLAVSWGYSSTHFISIVALVGGAFHFPPSFLPGYF